VVTDCLLLSHPQPRDTGDYLHRVTLPGQALARQMSVAELQTSHPAWLAHGLHARLLVVKMVADSAVLNLIETRRAAGRPTAFEISDDFRDFPPSSPGHAFYQATTNQALIEQAARLSHLVQFSSHGLAGKYGHLNPQHVVFANQLADVPALPEVDPARLRQPVLGWAGSAGHLEDARQLVAWLRPWYAARRQAGLVLPSLHVMAPDSVVAVFLSSGLPVTAQAPGGFDAYLAFLPELDIGLAILGDTDFARGRSDGKFLEYASRGAVCVASAAGEYLHGIRHGETGLLFDGPESLGAHLSALVDAAGERLRLRATAHAHVRTMRTHAIAARERARVYRELLSESESRNVPAGAGAHLAGCALQTGCREEDPTLHSLCDPTEPRFLEASTLHMRGLVCEALEGYLEVVCAHPDFHEPWARSALIARAMGSERDAALFEGMARQALLTQLQTPAQPA
jgi:hypothetical protein